MTTVYEILEECKKGSTGRLMHELSIAGGQLYKLGEDRPEGSTAEIRAMQQGWDMEEAFNPNESNE